VVKLCPARKNLVSPEWKRACFALQYGHGVGLANLGKASLAASFHWRVRRSLKRAWYCAGKRNWPASDGWSAARIEEQLVVTQDGCEVMTRFPAEELMVAGVKLLPRQRVRSRTHAIPQSHKNSDYTACIMEMERWQERRQDARTVLRQESWRHRREWQGEKRAS